MVVDQAFTTVAKPFWKSRIIWVQALSFVGAALTFLVDNAKPFGVALPPNVPGYVLMTVGLLNLLTVYLRTTTNQPVDASNEATPVTLRTVAADGDAKKVA